MDNIENRIYHIYCTKMFLMLSVLETTMNIFIGLKYMDCAKKLSDCQYFINYKAFVSDASQDGLMVVQHGLTFPMLINIAGKSLKSR